MIPSAHERAIARFVTYYTEERHHEALGNVTRADRYAGRQQVVLSRRQQIKRDTLAQRREENLKPAA